MEIPANNIVIREAVIRALSDKNKENREAEFVISTESEDSHGTVFKMVGWDLKRYEQNPIVCYQHRSGSDDPDMILGTSVVRIEDGQLIGVVRFESAEINPLAEKVWQKIQAGTLRMASISANIKMGHWGDQKLGENPDVIYFDEQELREWSIVALGSNPDALKRSQETMEAIRAEIKKEIPEVIDQPETVKRTVREAQLSINHNSY
jgi:hypothetical protein